MQRTGISSEAITAALAIFFISRARGADGGDAALLGLLGGALTEASPDLQQLIRDLPEALGQLGHVMQQFERLETLGNAPALPPRGGSLLLPEKAGSSIDAEKLRRAFDAARRVLQEE